MTHKYKKPFARPTATGLFKGNRHKIHLGFFAFLVFLSIVSCNRQQDKAVNTQTIHGVWERDAGKEPGGAALTLHFRDDGTYLLLFDYTGRRYPGEYELNGKDVKLIDYYCGTKLSGLYSTKIESDKLSFALLEDPYCERSKLLPGRWSRLKGESKRRRLKSIADLAAQR